MRHEKPVVLVDMDGVLTDFGAAVTNKLQSFHANIIIPQRVSNDIADDFPPELSQDIYEIIRDENFFNQMPLNKGAIEGWEQLLRLGYDPRVCSSPLADNPRCVEAKKEWLKEKMVPHFGSRVLNLAQITRDKHSIDAVANIDDNPLLVVEPATTWQHVMFTQRYNTSINTDLRLDGWRDPNIATVLDRATRRSYS